MRALRLDLFQEMACYKKPFALKISETYPLPPYSTVNGMLHKLLDAKEYIPMNISIQGDYESIVNNYQTTYFYKKKEVTTMPMNQHMLLNVKLIIHINAEDKILDKIYDSILNLGEYLSLGRKEDLVRIDEVKLVDVIECELEEDFNLKNEAYIPLNMINEESNLVVGTIYKINKVYKLLKIGKKQRRCWEQVDVVYGSIEESVFYEGSDMLIDTEGDFVFLA